MSADEMSDAAPAPAHERDIFIRAAEIADEARRTAYLDQACSGNAPLRARVEALLNADNCPTPLRTQEWVRDAVQWGARQWEDHIGKSTPLPVSGLVGWKPPSVDELDALMPDFKIEKLIGCGGMGAVFQCVQVSLERKVAVKILPPELSGDPSFTARFRREALSMAQLQHPNIVTIFDFGSLEIPAADGTRQLHYIVMELVDGIDLQQRMRRGKLDGNQILSLLIQMCDALECAHEHGCVHRDIKPANVFVTAGGRVKIGDFGIAKLIDGTTAAADLSLLTLAGTSPGTPHYMAPEQIGNPQAADPRSDLYGVGVILYQLLTGSLPKGVFPNPSEVALTDPRLDDIVRKALRSNPDQRYLNAAALRQDLLDLRTSTAASPSPTWASPPPLSPTIPARRLGWAAIVLLAILIAGWALRDRTPARTASDFHQDDPVVAGPLFWTGFANGNVLPPLRDPLMKQVSVFAADPKPRFVDTEGITRFVLPNATTAERTFRPNAIQLVTSQRLRAALFADGMIELHTYLDAATDPSYQSADDLRSVTQIALHNRSLLALLQDGTLRIIGPDTMPAEWMEIADGIQVTSGVVLRASGIVSAPTLPPPEDLANVSRIASSGGHCLALTQTGRVVAWGDNRLGACAVPTDLPEIVDIVALNRAAGSLALARDGSWYHWGNDPLNRWRRILPQLHGIRHLDAYQKGDDIWVVGILSNP